MSNKEAERKRYLRRYCTPRYRAQVMLAAAYKRARKYELPIDIDTDWIEEKLRAGFCEVTGLPFDFKSGKAKMHPWSPSLDRRDPRKGYTRENTQVTVWMYNACKGVADHEDVMIMARSLCRT